MNNKLNGQTNIYDIIKKEKLDVVNKPISKAHGLPNECYNSVEYTKIERKKLFEDKWVVIGVASSIPNPGNAKPFDLLGIPLILLRNKKNQIKVYHNVCSHRGYKILKRKCTIKNVLRCPYHSWTYSLNGELIARPREDSFNQIPKNKCNLKSIELREQSGLLWVQLTKNAVKESEKYLKN